MTEPMSWGTDVPVSMPQPLGDNQGVIDMDGFCFTDGGIAHNLSRADWEQLVVPTFAPEIPAAAVRYDAALDRLGEA